MEATDKKIIEDLIKIEGRLAGYRKRIRVVEDNGE